jgi:hypothetical protein
MQYRKIHLHFTKKVLNVAERTTSQRAFLGAHVCRFFTSFSHYVLYVINPSIYRCTPVIPTRSMPSNCPQSHAQVIVNCQCHNTLSVRYQSHSTTPNHSVVRKLSLEKLAERVECVDDNVTLRLSQETTRRGVTRIVLPSVFPIIELRSQEIHDDPKNGKLSDEPTHSTPLTNLASVACHNESTEDVDSMATYVWSTSGINITKWLMPSFEPDDVPDPLTCYTDSGAAYEHFCTDPKAYSG